MLAFPVDAQMRLVAAPRNGNGDANGKPAEPAYEDRVIEGLAPLVDESPGKPYETQGPPRYLRLETRLSTLPRGPRGSNERSVGFIGSGSLETPNHGVISFNAATTPDEGSNALTIRQRGLPVDGGWLVNNELGVTTPLAPGVMRLPSRVFVPIVVTRGAGTEWLQLDRRLQFQASTGERGRLQGYPVPGFLKLDGAVTTVAAQGYAEGWNVAARHAHADGISRFEAPGVRVTENSTHVAARRESGGETLSAQVIASRAGDLDGTRYGAWVEGEWRDGRGVKAFGIYRLDTKLSWAGESMAGDIEGAFVRGSWHSRQWNAEGSVDVLRSLSGDDDTGVLVTGSGQYRYSRSLTFGAGGAARRHNGDAGTLFGDVRWRHDWGTTGLRAETTRYDEERLHRLTLDQEWPLTLGWTLATSVSAGRETGSDRAGTTYGGAVSVAAPLGSNALLTANATYDRRGNGDHASAANVSLAWQFARDWALEGNFVYSRGRHTLFAPIDPLAPRPDAFALTNDTHSLYLVLRYETRAGSRTVPLGGPPGGGGGTVTGVVYLDANRNGSQEAAETGAAGVTVYLDGRYATRTDAQGRFEFPFVAPGARTITVLNETLPLPWDAGARAETRIEVRVREATRIAIPVERRTD